MKRRYMSFEEFAEYIATYDIDVVQLQLRGLTTNGERVSIFSRTDMGLDETKRILNEQASKGGYTIIGITGINAVFSPSVFSAVQEDSHTYFVDTGSELQLTQDTADSANAAGAFPQSLTWQLEDIGLLGK